ncbi:MAG: hypothetical protein JXR25_02115 [Pontiellaceae bacterium]|nr:hypothetical protein [Pontiellaceae bacterium]MBN2783595.1 hypothetical protein [Pontiellaceae bacterium]
MDIKIRKHSEFDPRRKQLLDSLVSDSKDLLKDLSSVEEIDPEKISKSITPCTQ